MSDPMFSSDQSVAALQMRIRDLETQQQALQFQIEQLQQQNGLYQLVIDHLPMRVFWKDVDDLRYLGCNYAFAHDAGVATVAEMIGKNDFLMTWSDQAAAYQADDRAVLASGQSRINYDEPQDRPDGSVAWLRTSKVPLYQPDGTLIGVLGTYEDVTHQRQQEQQRLQEQEQMIAAQQDTLRELSTPLIPLTDDVVVMPLVGTIDARRAVQIMETLLEGITHYHADIALLDISGVRVVDTQVADAFLRATRAAKLLGAQVVLTGISAEIAQTIVHLGADMNGLVTLATLREGLQFATTQP